MRFGNGRDGLNIDPGETTDVTCPNLGRDTGALLPEKRIQACIFQECLPKAQAKGLLSNQGDIKRI
jgi:hypothetical protein